MAIWARSRRDDALLMLSYRGETAELSDLITYAKRFSIPLIGMASNPELDADAGRRCAAAASRARRKPVPMGLAPTTSTTLMLVLGDALAVALMERKGFSADQYRNFHPGGSLGRMLIRVSDLMRARGSAAGRRSTRRWREVLATLSKGTLGCVVVVDDSRRRGRHHHPWRCRPAYRARFSRTQGPSGDDVRAQIRAARPACRRSAGADERKEDHPASRARSGRCRQDAAGILHIHDCLRAGLQ